MARPRQTKKDSATYASRPIRVNGCGIFFLSDALRVLQLRSVGEVTGVTQARDDV